MNIVAPILRFATTQPHAEALIDRGQTITYRQLAQSVLRTAAHLTKLGVARHDRVGTCLKDTADHIVILLALARLGAVSVPLDWRARAAETQRLVTAADVKLVLVESDAQSISGRAATVDESWQKSVMISEATLSDDVTGWNEPLIIAASSGSTGAPKLTLLTHLNFYFGTINTFEIMALAGRQRYLSTLPLYYGLGRNTCIAHLLRGDCVILHSNMFDAVTYAETVRRTRASVGRMVPTMVRRLLAEYKGADPLLPSLGALFSSGAALDAGEKRDALRRLTPTFHEFYGTAETMNISVLRPESIERHADSVGQPISLVEVEVVDDEDRPMKVGDAGHLRCRSPALAAPLPGAEAAFRNGWFYPGEIARLEELNYIALAGRASELIVLGGGVKVQPAEVEQVLREHGNILEAAVLGHSVAGKSEEVVAFLVVRETIDQNEIIAHCRSRLTAHKIPQRFHFLRELPKNTRGKIDKRSLAELLVSAGPARS